MPIKPLKIGIAGAGIGGMCLASILSNSLSKPIVHVYERDKRNRDQGTGFDISKQGQEALKRAKVFDKFWEYSRNGSNVMKLYVTGKNSDDNDPLFIMSQPKILERWFPPTPESNRELLRDAFIHSLGENGNVTFEKGVYSLNKTTDGKVELLGKENNVLDSYDIVIDAAGFNSPLRKYRINESDTSYLEYYTNVTMIHGILLNPDETCDEKLVKKLSQGRIATIGPKSRWLGLQRYGTNDNDNRTSFYYSLLVPESPRAFSDKLKLPPTSEFHSDTETLNKIKTWIHNDMGDNWSEMYHNCVDNLDSIAIRALFQHPPNPTFKHDSELPLICMGDSLHVLPPYTGAGGNLALQDAMDIADYIEKEDIHIETLHNLEYSLLERAKPIMKAANFRRDLTVKLSKYDDLTKLTLNELYGGTKSLHYIGKLMTNMYKLECALGVRKE